MSKNLPIFLCGPHCSGKTSMLKKLAEDKRIDECGFEIGKELFYSGDADTESFGADMEFKITGLELERDRSLAEKAGVFGLESWHPGNLAYAAERNPAVIPELIGKIGASPLIGNAHGICFAVSRNNIFSRTLTFRDNAEWAADFYTRLGKRLKNCAADLGLAERCVFIDANRPFDEVYGDVKKEVRRLRLLYGI